MLINLPAFLYVNLLYESCQDSLILKAQFILVYILVQAVPS
jgi:hypothetical protein